MFYNTNGISNIQNIYPEFLFSLRYRMMEPKQGNWPESNGFMLGEVDQSEKVNVLRFWLPCQNSCPTINIHALLLPCWPKHNEAFCPLAVHHLLSADY